MQKLYVQAHVAAGQHFYAHVSIRRWIVLILFLSTLGTTGVIALGSMASSPLATAAFAAQTAPIQPAEAAIAETQILSAFAGPVEMDGVTFPLDGEVVPFNNATFAFTSPTSIRFICGLDRQPTAPCTSPATYDNLAIGNHRFRVQALDDLGVPDPTPATVDWTIGTVDSTVITTPLAIDILAGPLFIGPDQLSSLTGQPANLGSPTPGLIDHMNQKELYTPGIGDPDAEDEECRRLGCPALPEGGIEGQVAAAALPDTPGLSAGPYIIGTGRNDPNLAASSTHLVASNNSEIRFFNKSGKLVDKDKSGNPFPGRLNMAEFFKWFFDPKDPNNLNTTLNLPDGLECDPTVYPWGSYDSPWGGALSDEAKAATADCYKQIYDTRVIFDEYRERFWVVSSVRNNAASVYDTKEDVNQRVGRRDMLLLAVSATADPRDGWWMYGWTGTIQTGACNDVGKDPGPPPFCPGTQYRPSDAADYPTLGISKNWVVMTIGVCNQNPWGDKKDCYTAITASLADQLAQGVCNKCGWHYGRIQLSNSNKTYSAATQASVQHKQSHDWALLASSGPGDALTLLGFRASEGLIAPPLHMIQVPIKPFSSGIRNMPQQPSAPVTQPFSITVSNLGKMALKAVMNDKDLYVTWQECKKWVGTQTECSTSIRLVGVANAVNLLELKAGLVKIDRTFGLRNYQDPQNAIVFYGNPAVEVNSLGDVVVVYNRSGSQVFLETRYSAFMHNEPDIRPSAILQDGDFPVGKNSEPPCKDANDKVVECNTLNVDTAGIALDPKDGVGIWMSHAFGTQNGDEGKVDFAIGRVFGKTRFDLEIFRKRAITFIPPNPKPGSSVRIEGTAVNNGDGAFPGAPGKIELVRENNRSLLGDFTLPRLAPGNSGAYSVTAQLPADLLPGQYTIEVTITAEGEEYSTDNNIAQTFLDIAAPTIYIHLPIINR